MTAKPKPEGILFAVPQKLPAAFQNPLKVRTKEIARNNYLSGETCSERGEVMFSNLLLAILSLVETIAILVGISYAVVQIRLIRRNREIEGSFEMLRSYQVPEFARAVALISNLPDNISADELRKRLNGDVSLIYNLGMMWESIGALVFREQLHIDLVEDYFSGIILVSWRKLNKWVENERIRCAPTYFEWFQWLVERISERNVGNHLTPAHIKYAKC